MIKLCHIFTQSLVIFYYLFINIHFMTTFILICVLIVGLFKSIEQLERTN